jgi:hypothetical protein
MFDLMAGGYEFELVAGGYVGAEMPGELIISAVCFWLHQCKPPETRKYCM